MSKLYTKKEYKEFCEEFHTKQMYDDRVTELKNSLMEHDQNSIEYNNIQKHIEQLGAMRDKRGQIAEKQLSRVESKLTINFVEGRYEKPNDAVDFNKDIIVFFGDDTEISTCRSCMDISFITSNGHKFFTTRDWNEYNIVYIFSKVRLNWRQIKQIMQIVDKRRWSWTQCDYCGSEEPCDCEENDYDSTDKITM